MEKKPTNPVWGVVQVLFIPLLIVVAGVAFFFLYNTYLIDNSLESLKFSLNKVSSAKTVEEARNLKILLGEALIREVSAEKLDTANVANLEFTQNIISEAKVNDQLKDLKLILSSVVKSKEAKRSKVLLKLDAINEKIKSALLKMRVRLRGKAKRAGVEVSDLSLLDAARKFETDWKIQEAVSNYGAFIKQYPDYKDIGWVHLRLGYAYLKIGNLREAERLFSYVEKEYLEKEEVLVAQKFLVTIKGIQKSLKDREILLGKIKTARTDVERQKIYYDIGVIDTYNYNLGSARDFFKKTIEMDPQSLLAQKAQFNIGWSLKFQNDLEKSALVFEDVINIYAKGDIVLNAKYQLADTYHKSGKFEEAIAIYKKIAQDYKDKPIAPLAQFQAGYSYLYNMNDPIQASDIFKAMSGEFKSSALANYAAMDLVPTLESRFRDYAFTLLIEGKYEKARDAFMKAIEVNKNDAWAHGGLSGSYIRLDKIKEGLSESEVAVGILADEYTYAGLAFSLEMMGRLDEAVENYKKSIAVNKEYMLSHYNIARLYEMQARYDEAVVEDKEVVRITPEFSCAYANMGHAYWFKGEVLNCLEEYKKALSLEPNCVETHYNLGLIFKALGRRSEAREEFEEALKIAPSFKETASELEGL